MNSRRIDLSALPTPIFGAAMGVQGLALVVFNTGESLHPIAIVVSFISLAVLALTLFAHGAKQFRYSAQGRNDLRTPGFVCFYGQPAVTVLLSAEIFMDSAHAFAAALTLIGAVIAALSGLALAAARGRSPEPGNPLPPQLIPGIACLMVPITARDFVSDGWCWAIFGAAVALLTVFYLSSPVGVAALPAPLAPTAAIHLAVPAVACVDVALLAPGTPLAQIALGVVGFVFAGLVIQLRRLSAAPFGLAWWAFTMPFSAAVLALSAVVPRSTGWWSVIDLGAIVNALIVAAIGGRTIVALARGTLLPTVPRSAPAPEPIVDELISTTVRE